jgi:hypothetical protein
MNRIQLSRVRSVAGFALGIETVVFTAVVRGGDLLVRATVGVVDAAIPNLQVCGDDGKVKTFRDMDDFVKQAAKLSAFKVTGVSIEFDNLEVLDPKPYTGDYITKNRATIVSYSETKTKLTTTATEIQEQIINMPSTTAAEIALKAEKQAQKDAVTGQIAWLNSEVTRITALLPQTN